MAVDEPRHAIGLAQIDDVVVGAGCSEAFLDGYHTLALDDERALRHRRHRHAGVNQRATVDDGALGLHGHHPEQPSSQDEKNQATHGHGILPGCQTVRGWGVNVGYGKC